MEVYDPATVFSSIDRHSRYAYGNQPRAALWNLARLAEALLPVLVQEAGSEEAALASAEEALAAFEPQFVAARNSGLKRKLGLFTEGTGDAALAEDLLERMAANRADFTLTFRRLCDAAAGPEGDGGVRAQFADAGAYDAWATGWRRRLDEEPVSREERAASMRRTNPAFIPRNHLVEAALNAAVREQDLQLFEELLDVVSNPFEDRPDRERYATPARPEESVTQTFCGT
jgi:uncharacterized protein YdiU (UPF0061 family)